MERVLLRKEVLSFPGYKVNRSANFQIRVTITQGAKIMCLDGSGWAWFIPLHNNTTSVGVVMQQTSFTAKKKQMESPTTRDFFLQHMNDAPMISDLLENATLVSEVKSATDWSYSASSYASPYIRIVGDAGCFIDPLFSSGVHLAFTGAISAAASICAAIKEDCTEQTAVNWHSEKIREAYTRFLLVVTSAYAQITGLEQPVLNEYEEKNFDRAFGFFRPSKSLSILFFQFLQATLIPMLIICQSSKGLWILAVKS
jgi:2-polyprenyl-6-methoxyphenol hydroxylase-like FAD-dependent oxidoreductase